MKLFDSYTNTLVDFDENEISIYNCGPTVYNHIHIGNARPLVSMDVLYRFLLAKKKSVKYVLNITDIDDKIINYALANNRKELEVSEEYFQAYLQIKKQLNTLPMTNPKVSDHMDDIITYIETLLQQDKAYVVGDDIYFDTSCVSNYGKLSKIKVEENIHGKRIVSVKEKRNPNDFILWKKTDKGLVWNTPFGIGRPGWHTECVCLINKYLGKQISIHGGGMDLKFPHHENENAQNNAMYSQNLARIWMHFGLINIDNQKMSKSLNNFILMKDLLEQYSYQAIRWFFYQTKYSQPLNFSHEILKQCENDVLKIKQTLIRLINFFVLSECEYAHLEKNVYLAFDEHMENDLNFANMIKVVFDLLKNANLSLKTKDLLQISDIYQQLIYCLDILGIEFTNVHTPDNIALLRKWHACVKHQKYEEADELRTQLIGLGLL
ncbi:cysteine--tRNA ligase [Ureaplasma miroungigenitalium]|uniref:Cysteine--tRNA ligase n=1 Tax=Ureaplasma miroungigenitalium TaxID=1042321 RepID=A0ABT3BN83_9BACT|nr:cysteine--tRNA ligase [Ureaplasma miroungigenitalium]MCV3728487.1 cysteine--tRNA ligase [Ureaplasma miroungigenitalium]MCV3734274.1 cysteine--tRNA ligase [Ureaplasma miroungigenitalium]